MKKYNILLILVIFSVHFTFAQKELWGVNPGAELDFVGNPGYNGNITKYDINGEDPIIVHEFDSFQGFRPIGNLYQASNGKLYGTTSKGGIPGPIGSNSSGGVLFEYDLIIDKYRVVMYFDYGLPNSTTNPEIGVIEPIPGTLVGAANNRIYKFDIATESIIFSNPLLYGNAIYGELMKASNGFIYGTSHAGNCNNIPLSEPRLGNIIKYNIITHNLSFAHSIVCGELVLKGSTPITKLIESSPGKLYGTCRNGGANTFSDPLLRAGTLFEFDINTNVFTKKIDFNYPTIGVYPLNLVLGDNGKIYGLCGEGGISTCGSSTLHGTLFEYTTSTNELEVKRNFNYCDNPVGLPSYLMKTSNGNFIGTIPNGGLFRYDANNNTITMPNYTSSNINLYNSANLIEICRKPSYQEIIVNTFDTCVGGSFTYDLQNDNATSYVWQKNGINVVGQTIGILNLSNLTISNAGAYTCVMTNECGTTTTMPINITVNCLGVNTIANLEKAIKFYPNPTNSNLTIELPTNIDVKITSLKVTDLLGKEVLLSNNGTTNMDVSHLSNGIYILTLETNYGNWNEKFVKI